MTVNKRILLCALCLALWIAMPVTAQAQVNYPNAAENRFLREELEIMREAVAMSIALNHADVSTNKKLKLSFATGIYDDAVAVAGMAGYRPPEFNAFTLRAGVAYGVEKEEYAGSFGFAAQW